MEHHSARFFKGVKRDVASKYELISHLGRGACELPSRKHWIAILAPPAPHPPDPPMRPRITRAHPPASHLLAWTPADGEVWAARDPKTRSDPTHKVAIKKICSAFSQATESKRILRELRILRHLSHPNVIKIREVLRPESEVCSLAAAGPTYQCLSRPSLLSVPHSSRPISPPAADLPPPRARRLHPHPHPTVRPAQSAPHCPHSPTLPGRQATFTDLWVVFDFVDLDLRKLIASPQTISVAHVQWITHQILIALQYLHSAHVLHRDLKPANVRVEGGRSGRIRVLG